MPKPETTWLGEADQASLNCCLSLLYFALPAKAGIVLVAMELTIVGAAATITHRAACLAAVQRLLPMLKLRTCRSFETACQRIALEGVNLWAILRMLTGHCSARSQELRTDLWRKTLVP